MTKKEFLDKLRDSLGDLKKSERETTLKLYEDYFESAGENNEKKVIKELGTPEKIASLIKGESNKNVIIKPSIAERYSISGLFILLIALLIFPVVISIIGIFIGLFIITTVILFSLIVVGIVTLISGVGVFIYGIIGMFSVPFDGLIQMGLGSMLIGVGVLIILLMIKLFVIIIPLIINGFINIVKIPFGKRGN